MSFTEELTWITADGDDWLTETRTHRFHGVDAERGLWLLDFSTTLRNVSGRGSSSVARPRRAVLARGTPAS